MKRCWFHTISNRPEVVTSGESDQKESQSAAQEPRFQTAAQAQQGKIERTAHNLGHREAQLPSARGQPVNDDREDHDGEDEPAQVGPERQIEQIEGDRLAEDGILKAGRVLERAAAGEAQDGPVIDLASATKNDNASSTTLEIRE